MLREGSIVDASILSAPTSKKNQAGKRGPEMHQTKKGNEWHFGMKMHIGADRVFGYHKVRYQGLAKNTERLHVLAAFSNLMIGKKYLLT